jgi:hypothetical protein
MFFFVGKNLDLGFNLFTFYVSDSFFARAYLHVYRKKPSISYNSSPSIVHIDLVPLSEPYLWN